MAETRSKWRQLRRLSGWQWRVLLTTPFVLLFSRIRLRRAGYGAALHWAQGNRMSDLPAQEQLELARATAYAFAVAIKYGPWRPLCLLRSVALGRLLGRRGLPFEIRIGLPGGAGGQLDFTAHAWVEHAGVVLNDKQGVARRYSPF